MKTVEIKLTEIQKAAAEFTKSNLLLSAGAGTGKTRVLVERFLHFVTTGKAPVDQILALTFTEKAANEMKERIMKRLTAEGLWAARRDLEKAYISTLHAFASRVLKEHPIEACVHPEFRVAESEEAAALQFQALDDVIETHCIKGSAVFEFFKIYGESQLRKAILKIHDEARTAGWSLNEFFERPYSLKISSVKDPAALFEKAGEPELVTDWKRFQSAASWDWKTVEEFREWKKTFSRKRKTPELWAEIKEQTELFLQLKIEKHLEPWKLVFENLCIAFEASYEAVKNQKGVLDFDDLQLKALQLFTGKGPGQQRILRDYREHFKFVLVDEYQDINPLQAKLIECFAGPNNLFMVGDYKQSIYRFRGTSPEHFLEKEKRYKKKEGGERMAMLGNFRTAAPVLEFINRFFEILWEEDRLPNEPLTCEISETGHKPELLLIEKTEEESLDEARMREAAMIAARMRELNEEGVEYGKMAVLFQTMTEIGIYEHALKSAGIPYFVVSGRGFYFQPEIRDMMSLLGALENPLSDIPLAAALRSPFFTVTDNTLVWLARAAKEGDENKPLYNGFLEFEKIKEITEQEKMKLRRASSLMKTWLAAKDRLRLAELLEQILEDTSYELHALASRQGIRRFANLRKLAQIARDSESHELMSLSDFIRLIRGLESREMRESEAQVEAEESGKVVRLMTVHAAKGLEFPICFVANLGHEGQSPESRRFLASAALKENSGYSFQVLNTETMKWESPYSYARIKESLDREDTEEWKRLFYVAVTRAERRLILSGVYKKKKEPKEKFCDMSSWMDWLVAVKDRNLFDVRDTSAVFPKRTPQVAAESQPFETILKNPEIEAAAELPKDVLEVFNRIERQETPFSRVIDLPVSAYALYAKNPKEYWAVYEVGWSDGDEKIDVQAADVPAEADEGPDAADFGTSFHRLLERLNFQDPEPEIQLLAEEIYYGEQPQVIEEACRLARQFIKTEMFETIKNARHVYRELPFVLNERHGKIHGVLDLLIQNEAGDWIVIDYKTATGDEAKAKQSAYDLQIAIYAAAVQQISGIVPKQGMVYFIKNNKTYAMDFTREVLAGHVKKIKAMQEEILEFSKKMMDSYVY